LILLFFIPNYFKLKTTISPLFNYSSVILSDSGNCFTCIGHSSNPSIFTIAVHPATVGLSAAGLSDGAWHDHCEVIYGNL